MSGLVVVGIDGSAPAARALRWALEEARLRGATLRVVHAWSVAVLPVAPGAAALGAPGLGLDVDALRAEARRQAEGVLETALDDAGAAEAGVEVERALPEEAPARALVAESEGADLLVVGTRGHGGFTGLLLGSVGQQCTHHARCPVVVVREREE